MEAGNVSSQMMGGFNLISGGANWQKLAKFATQQQLWYLANENLIFGSHHLLHKIVRRTSKHIVRDAQNVHLCCFWCFFQFCIIAYTYTCLSWDQSIEAKIVGIHLWVCECVCVRVVGLNVETWNIRDMMRTGKCKIFHGSVIPSCDCPLIIVIVVVRWVEDIWSFLQMRNERWNKEEEGVCLRMDSVFEENGFER